MGKLDGKVAIVTGSGKGIGRGEAIALAKEGARVTVLSRTIEDVQRTAAEIQDLGGEAIAIRCDVGDADQIQSVVDRTVEAFGTVDILINNAQYIPAPADILEWTENKWRACFETGPLASWLFMKACFPHLKTRGGKIINTCSATGYGGVNLPPLYVGYAAAKEAIRSLTRDAAKAWAKHNINVNVISPASRDQADSNASAHAALEQINMPIARWGDPEQDIGRIAVFLASADSDYITGQTISADGGLAMIV